MKDYRIVAKVKNNRIAGRIEAMGFPTVSAFCRAHDLSVSGICALIAMTDSPLRARGGWTKYAVDLATALKVLPEDLFNDHQKRGTAGPSVFIREADTDALPKLRASDLALPSPEAEVIARIDAHRLMQCLKPREKQMIEMRYGIDGAEEATEEQIGHRFGISTPRVHQILHKAQQRMRRPSNGGQAYYT